MIFKRLKELFQQLKTSEEQFSSSTYGLLNFFLLLFQVFILLSLSNHVWDQDHRIVACVILSSVLNLVSFTVILYWKKNFFEIFFLLSLAVFWIGTFHSPLDKLPCLLSQKVAIFLEAELYYMCLIVLIRNPIKIIIAFIGYLRIFIGLNLLEIEEIFTYEKTIGAVFYVLSFVVVTVLSLAIIGNNAGKYFLQQKQQMRYIDLENILNNDIQQGILIVTPNKSAKSSPLRVEDLKVKYVNNCFLEQFNVSKLLALNLLPLIQARPPKLQPKIDQDISCNYSDSTKNILDRSVEGGVDVVPKNGTDQLQRRSIFATDIFKGGVKAGTEGSEMNGETSREEDHQNIVSKPVAMRTSIFKKESLIKPAQNSMGEDVQLQKQKLSQQQQQPIKNQNLSQDRIPKLSIENNNIFNGCRRRKESHEGTISSSMNLLDGINLYHQHYLQRKITKKQSHPLLESQLIVWEYKQKNAATIVRESGVRKSFLSRHTKTMDEFGSSRKQNQGMVKNKENINNASYLSKNNQGTQAEQQEQSADANILDIPYPDIQQNISLPVQNMILNQKLVNSSSSPSNYMLKLFSDQISSTLEMQPFQNQPTIGSSEVAFSKHHHDNKKLSIMTMTNPNPEKDMKSSRKSSKRPRSYLNHNDKLSAQQLDDNTFEIVRKDKKSKTEIGRGRLGKKQDSQEDDDDLNGSPVDKNGSIMDYFDIKLFECEMGKEESIMIVVNKVNERIKYEKLKEQQEKSEEMLANVTHDLKTPLNCMTLMAEGMKIGKEYDEVAISMILENSYLLMCLIQDILDYSQIKKGKLRLLRTTFTPNEAINEVMSLFQMQADQKNIQLISQVDQNFTMNSDKNRIKQILINLVGNALKFTQQGSIQITCQIDHHKIATFSVRDTGVGMTNQIKSQLFKKFNTFNQKGLNKNGVGLGLTICKRLVTFLGPSDTIEVESEVAKGSVFSFKVFLDLTDILDSTNKSISEESDDLAQQDSNNKYYEEQLVKHKNHVNKCAEQEFSGYERSRSISISGNLPFQKLNCKESDSNDVPSSRSLNKEEEENKIEDSVIAVNSLPQTIIHSHAEFKTIPQQISKISTITDLTTVSQPKAMLIVDDSPFNIAAYKLILKKYKPLSIVEAYNGKDAFEKYQKTSFSCILMDYNMPIMNGDEATRLIRKFEKLNNLPACKIIIVSGFDNHRKEINKAMQFGADDYLTKPVDFKLLFEKLNQLLE